MKVTSVLHAAILVSDLDAAKEFYEGILGLRQKPRPNLKFPGAWYDLGHLELHLIVTTHELPSASERPERDCHLALAVEDLEAIKNELKSAGVPFREGFAKVPQIFIRDPDGNLIELQKM